MPGAAGTFAQSLSLPHHEWPQPPSPQSSRQVDLSGSPHDERVQDLKEVRRNAPVEQGEEVTGLKLAGAEVAREERSKSQVKLLSPEVDAEEEAGTASGEVGPEGQRQA